MCSTLDNSQLIWSQCAFSAHRSPALLDPGKIPPAAQWWKAEKGGKWIPDFHYTVPGNCFHGGIRIPCLYTLVCQWGCSQFTCRTADGIRGTANGDKLSISGTEISGKIFSPPTMKHFRLARREPDKGKTLWLMSSRVMNFRKRYRGRRRAYIPATLPRVISTSLVRLSEVLSPYTATALDAHIITLVSVRHSHWPTMSAASLHFVIRLHTHN